MNKLVNLKEIENFGDFTQLSYGNMFGYYANRLDHNHLRAFCNYLNSHSWCVEKGYYFYNNSCENNMQIVVKNRIYQFEFTIKLFDHTIFFNIPDGDWIKVSTKLYALILLEWRKFLAKNVEGYRQHFNNLIVLSQIKEVKTLC